MRFALTFLLLLPLACSVETMTNSSSSSMVDLAPGVKADKYDWTYEKGDREGSLSVVVCYPSTASHFTGTDGATADPWRRVVEQREEIDGEEVEVYTLDHDMNGSEVVINGKAFDTSGGRIFVVTRGEKKGVVQLRGEPSLLETDREELAKMVAAVLEG